MLDTAKAISLFDDSDAENDEETVADALLRFRVAVKNCDTDRIQYEYAKHVVDKAIADLESYLPDGYRITKKYSSRYAQPPDEPPQARVGGIYTD